MTRPVTRESRERGRSQELPVDADGTAMPASEIPDLARKGRGAVSNRPGRYEPGNRPREDDGWPGGCAGTHPESEDEDLPPLRTTVTIDATRSAIAWNESPDIGFDRSLNAYRGCEHGCVYCFARPTHAYLGLSPGLDFETKLFAKPEAPRLLAEELSKRGYSPAPLALGTNTDPYQPIEREMRITRGVLGGAFRLQPSGDHRHQIGAGDPRHRHPGRDGEASRLATVSLSITTLDKHLARKMEPRATTPPRRLEAVRHLADAGIPVGVLAAPMIPALNDMELEAILAASAKAGATSAGYVLLRLPLEIKDLFTEWLEAHEPAKARHVLNLIRDTRRGALYVDKFGERGRGTGPYAELLAKRFRLAVKRLGLERRGEGLRCDLFKPPPRKGDQLSLL